MGLSYYYEFHAPAEVTTSTLEQFLESVQKYADSIGFKPSILLNVPFDTDERREFSRRLGGSYTVQDERLKGVAIPDPKQVRDHDPTTGECRLIPQHGVVLVITDERGCEVCFGFFRFPEYIVDINGKILAETKLGLAWAFRDFVDTPDSRYREIVRKFVDAGYLKNENDEFAG